MSNLTKGRELTVSEVDVVAMLEPIGTSLQLIRVNAAGDGLEYYTPSGGSLDGSGTANELAYWVDSDTLGALAVATYPSLTEISYIKGLSSAVQTQLNGKQATITFGTGVETALGVNIGSAGAFITFNGDAGTPSALVGTNITGTASGLSIGGNAATATTAGTVTTAAQPNITSLGTLTALQVDNININGNTIISTDTNGNINITPDGTGNVAIGTLTFNADQTVGAGQDNYVLTYDNGTGLINLEAAASAGANTALSNLASVAINTTLVSDTDNTDALGTTAIAWSDLFLGSGAVITFNSAPSTPDVTLTHSANTLTLAGGTLALGSESITMTGSIAATGARVTKGWFTDIESTNMPTVGGIAILTSLTAPQFTTIELGHATANTLSASGGILSIEGVAIPTISSADTLSNKTLTAPKFADLGFIADANGNELLILDTVASAVNEITFANAATGGNPNFSATGGDANIGIDFTPKGTGAINIKGNATQAATLRFYEDTDDGSNFSALRGSARTTDITYTMPTADPTAGQVLSAGAPSGGVSALSWATAGGGGDGTVFLPASAMASASADLSLTGTGNTIAGRGFTDGATESAAGVVRVPTGYSGITSIEAVYYSASTGNLRLEFTTASINHDSSNSTPVYDVSDPTALYAGVTSGNYGIITVPTTSYNALTNTAAGDLISIKVERTGAHGDDSYNTDWFLIGFIFRFTAA